jgi:predicted Zn-dependent protease
LKRGSYLLRDLGIISAAVAVMVFSGLWIDRLVKNRSSRKPHAPRPAVLSVESALKSLISESIKADDHLAESPALDRALDSIMGRLLDTFDPLPYEIEILVLRSPVVNAVNFPGGLIVVYSGLIMELDSPEEMAAVLAHEIGHVVNRDSVKVIMRQAGMSVFFSMFGGRGGQVLLQRILRETASIQYSRHVEQMVDDFALELLIAAQIDPAYMGKALENISRDEGFAYGGFLRYIDTHPQIENRIKMAYERSDSAHIHEKKFDINWENVKASLPEPETDVINIENLLR